MVKFTFSLVVAYSFPSRGIGEKGKIHWNIPDDMKRFVSITTQSDNGKTPVIVMGRKTWDSLPHKPLRNRINIVLSKTLTERSDSVIFCKFEDLLTELENLGDITTDIKVIGGGEIYNLFLDSEHVISHVYTTEIYKQVEPSFDTTFPRLNDLFKIKDVSVFKGKGDEYFRYITFTKDGEWENTEEMHYLRLMKEIIGTDSRDDRTGVGTFGLFGKQLSYDLSDTFPISTTKRMFMRGIFEELMMYLRGQTDNNILVSKGIHVWDGNTTSKFLTSRGLSGYKEGDMGSTYGFNFRHFGATYRGCSETYTGEGVDQLTQVIHLIKTDPTSRRMIINLWDPKNNDGAALPACLCMYQFYVRKQRYLDLQIYIRSSDYFLANNWNTCTGALLVHLICSLTGVNLEPGNLTVCMGDVHVYKTHIEQVTENIKRKPFPFPKLVIHRKKDNIEDFEFTDIWLLGYKSHSKIKAEMAV